MKTKLIIILLTIFSVLYCNAQKIELLNGEFILAIEQQSSKLDFWCDGYDGLIRPLGALEYHDGDLITPNLYGNNIFFFNLSINDNILDSLKKYDVKYILGVDFKSYIDSSNLDSIHNQVTIYNSTFDTEAKMMNDPKLIYKLPRGTGIFRYKLYKVRVNYILEYDKKNLIVPNYLRKSEREKLFLKKMVKHAKIINIESAEPLPIHSFTKIGKLSKNRAKQLNLISLLNKEEGIPPQKPTD